MSDKENPDRFADPINCSAASGEQLPINRPRSSAACACCGNTARGSSYDGICWHCKLGVLVGDVVWPRKPKVTASGHDDR